MCGKSETVPSSRIVTIEQPHPTLAHWKRTLKSNLNPETQLRTKNQPVLGQNNPHFTVRTLKVLSSRTNQPGDRNRPAPGAPPSGLTSKWPSLTPFSGLCRQQGCWAAVAGVPFLAVFAPLFWTWHPGRKREWKTRKVAYSAWTPGKEGSRDSGDRVDAHKEDPSLASCFILVPTSLFLLPPPSSEPLILPVDADPILGTVTPSHAVEGTHPPTHWPLPHFSPAKGSSSHTALFAAMRPPQQYPRGGPNAHCT